MKYEELDKELGSINMKTIKPNISALSRKYNVSRGMVMRHLAAMDITKEAKERKRRECGIMNYESEIKELLKSGNNSIKAIYMYILNIAKTYDEIGSYSNFKQYVTKHYSDERKEGKKVVVSYRYETKPAKQIQFDWIENLHLKLADDTTVNFNIWSATLGYSRYHIFKPTIYKTEKDMMRCFIDTCLEIGGVPEEALTDNMSAIVTIQGAKRIIHPTVIQFFKDMGAELKLCKIRTPKTKGKCEVSNKYQTWLSAYDGKFSTKEDLLLGIEQILKQCNYQTNNTTQIAPIHLFKKEKGSLKPVPAINVLRGYYKDFSEKFVDKSALIHYCGASYGVPSTYCNKNVLIMEEKNEIFLYDTALNSLCEYPKYQKGIHYAKGLYNVAKLKDETEEQYNKRIEDNLNRLANVGSTYLEVNT